VQPADRAEATTASDYHGGFATHLPGCGGTANGLDRGSGGGNIGTVMLIKYEVERDIVEYLGAHYSIEPDEITEESTLEDLGVDSLGVLAIADIVETKYGISLNDERIAGVRTLSDFKDLISLKIAEMA
jgi:acyl carrier protein